MTHPSPVIRILLACTLILPVSGCMLPQGDLPIVPPGVAAPGRGAAPARPTVDKVPATTREKLDPGAAAPPLALDPALVGARDPQPPAVMQPPSVPAESAAALPPSLVGDGGRALPSAMASAAPPPASAPQRGWIEVVWPAGSGIAAARVVNASGATVAELSAGKPQALEPGSYTLEVSLEGRWQALGATPRLPAGRHLSLELGVEAGRARIESSVSRSHEGSAADAPASGTGAVTEAVSEPSEGEAPSSAASSGT